MNSLEKVKRHLSRPIPITLKDPDGQEDTFMFRPLNIEQQAILMELSKQIEKRDKVIVEGEEVLDVHKEDMEEMFDLVLDITKNSMRDIDGDILKDFVNNNFNELSGKISDLIPKNINHSALNKIKKVQEEHHARKSGN